MGKKKKSTSLKTTQDELQISNTTDRSSATGASQAKKTDFDAVQDGISVRQFTTSEMGGIRYRASCESRRFPVEISCPAVNQDSKFLYGSWMASGDPRLPMEIISSEAILVVDAPIGTCIVQVFSSNPDSPDCAYHKEFVVQPTDMPNTQRASRRFSGMPLTSTKSFPGVQIVGDGNFRIVFNEVSWARAVRVVGDIEALLTKNDLGEWTTDMALPSKDYSFRFEMDLGEATTAGSGPMTEFGWDSRLSSSHTLVSSHLSFTVHGSRASGMCVSAESIKEFEEIERIEKVNQKILDDQEAPSAEDDNAEFVVSSTKEATERSAVQFTENAQRETTAETNLSVLSRDNLSHGSKRAFEAVDDEIPKQSDSKHMKPDPTMESASRRISIPTTAGALPSEKKQVTPFSWVEQPIKAIQSHWIEGVTAAFSALVLVSLVFGGKRRSRGDTSPEPWL
mmetsp:Transcript_7365/g.13296  ORF Transcript_7365/g.13296 Transcript_7365/m.13296 type:complete len:452 (-) Transcript_7365:490-1845(-)|eukprot:CAMPEP_0182444082 /NCGR_PEP_ID=MMETSP1172-20130603/2643_1 /TAXON_ID=708627 /ORGANISM="Timspurckia oligopyrenoides, Strain CCMP3278" /LENGTH=451 /DNA_ID=CAMNT_0024639553 /DNA_START=68 /DNA_END=1423 /DNA_ORIENTATION=+